MKSERVYCARCDARYVVHFDQRNRTTGTGCTVCAEKAPGGKLVCYEEWSRRPRAEVEKLVLQFQRLVYQVAIKKVMPRFHSDMIKAVGGIEEISAQGQIGLLHAARRYDGSFVHDDTKKPVKFITYATVALQRHIQRWVESQLIHGASGFPIREKHRTVGIKPVLWLEEIWDGDEFPLIAPPTVDTDEEMAVHEALAKLDPKRREVLRGRYFAHEPLKVIGKRMGVTQERVRQIECEAIADLQDLFAVEGPREYRGKRKLAV